MGNVLWGGILCRPHWLGSVYIAVPQIVLHLLQDGWLECRNDLVILRLVSVSHFHTLISDCLLFSTFNCLLQIRWISRSWKRENIWELGVIWGTLLNAWAYSLLNHLVGLARLLTVHRIRHLHHIVWEETISFLWWRGSVRFAARHHLHFLAWWVVTLQIIALLGAIVCTGLSWHNWGCIQAAIQSWRWISLLFLEVNWWLSCLGKFIEFGLCTEARVRSLNTTLRTHRVIELAVFNGHAKFI